MFERWKKKPPQHQDTAAVAPVAQPPQILDQETMAVTQILDSISGYYQNQQLMRSNNLMNGLSGAGGPGDKSGFFQFMPFWLNSQRFVEDMCIQSWVASRFVNMPIDDMFSQERQYSDDRFLLESQRVSQDTKLAAAMRTARKYGTGLLWAVTKETAQELPLDVRRIRPGDLTNLLVFDRYSASVVRRNSDINSIRFGQPEYYQLHLHGVGTYTVHASRVYRFDGLTPDTANGWQGYERDWGISNLAHAMTEIFNDASTVQAINHLVQEASIPVQKVQGLQDILCSQPLPDEPSMEERMSRINMYKSIYRTLLMDSNDDFDRVGVTFSGLPDLLEKSADRLAMSAGISATRFLNKSPDGENSTGMGDMLNDNRTTSTRQKHMLKPAYSWLDPIVAASAGAQIPDYEFPPLFEPTPKQVAEVDKTRAEAASSMTTSAVWSEDEAKEYMATGILPTGSAEGESSD